MRPVWLAIGTVLTAGALFLSTALLWDGFANAGPPTEERTRAIPFSGGKLAVQTAGGNVSLNIVPGIAGEVGLTRRIRWSATKPKITEDWNGSSLRLSAECPGEDEERVCDADYTVFVPVEVEIEATTAGGMLEVSDLYGDVRATSTSGDIAVRQTMGALRIRSGSGDVNASGLRGERADVETGSGDVNLYFHEAPKEVKAVVRTVGDVRIRVDSGTYALTIESAINEINVDQDLSAPRKIVARAPNGSVEICCS